MAAPDLNQQALGELIGYDGSVVSRLLSGKYPTDITPIIVQGGRVPPVDFIGRHQR